MPPEYIPLPYIRPRYEQGDTLGRLLQLRGNQQADAELRRGDASARMWSTLGQTIGDTVQGVVQAQERGKVAKAEQTEKAELSKRDTAYMKYISENPDPDPRVVVGIYGPRLGMTMVQGYKAFQELETGKVTNARDTAGRLAVGLKAASPALQATLWPRVREAAIKGGLGTAQDIPEQSSPEYLDAIIGWSTGREPVAKTPESLIQHDPTRDLVRPSTGEVVRAGVPAPTAPKAAPATIDAAILAADREGNQAEVTRLLGVKRSIEAAGRAPERPKEAAAAPKLPAGMATTVAASQTSLAALDKLEGLFKDEMVGPWAGRYNKYERGSNAALQALLPDAPPGFEDFSAETATLKNQVIQAITGAAVGVQEQGRIMEQIPDVTNSPMNWKAKAKATRRNLQELIANQIRMGTGAQAPPAEMSVDLPALGGAPRNPFRK